MPFSGAGLHNSRALSSVFDGDNAELLSLMLAAEPRPLNGDAICRLLSLAVSRSRSNLITLISSIVEQESLAANVSHPEASNLPAALRRL